jgi:hypothetical protein
MRENRKKEIEKFISDDVGTHSKQKYGNFKPFLSPIDLE